MKLAMSSKSPGDSDWPASLSKLAYSSIDLIGDPSLLSRRSIAIFCSSKCPGDIILKATKWIATLADSESKTIVSGFHSAMEKGFLEILLNGRCRIIVCPPRSLVRYRIPIAFKPAITEKRLAVVSALAETVRSNSSSSSLARNRLVADLATEVFVAHAAEGSRTEAFAIELLQKQKSVLCIDPRCNTLLSAGAKLFPIDS